MKFVVLLIGYLLPKLSFGNAIDFPNDIQKCQNGDNTCITNTISYILQNMSKGGEKAINLVNLSPLHITELNIKQGKESPVNINLLFTNNSLYGFDDATAIKTKGFSKNLAGPHEIILKTNRLQLLGKYKINGRVLILPIQGEGTSNMTIVKPTTKITFTGEPIEKDGKIYMKVKDFKMELRIKRLIMHLNNLFNGDKALGDNMNRFVNDNWSDIYGELQLSIETSFGKVLREVVNNVYQSHPYNELFL